MSYVRKGSSGEELVVVINFTPTVYHDYIVNVPCEGIYEELINSDAEEFGGSGVVNAGAYEAFAFDAEGFQHGIRITVPPLGACIFRKKEDAFFVNGLYVIEKSK